MKRRNGVLLSFVACACAALLPALADPISGGPILNLGNCKGFLDGKGGDRAQIVLESEEVFRKGKNFVVRRGGKEVVVDRNELETYLLLQAYRFRAVKANYVNSQEKGSVEKLKAFINNPSSRGKVMVFVGDDDVQEVSVLADGRIRLRSPGGEKLVYQVVMDLATCNSNMEEARHQGQLTACKSNLKNIATALEMYASDCEGRYPESLNPPLIQGNYLKLIPTCPAAGTITYQYSVNANPDRFTLSCQGSHHTKAGMKENRPGYSSDTGLLEQGQP